MNGPGCCQRCHQLREVARVHGQLICRACLEERKPKRSKRPTCLRPWCGVNDRLCVDCAQARLDDVTRWVDLSLGPDTERETAVLRTPTSKPMRPRIVCLCGSTRFKDEFMKQNARLTAEGYIVLSVGFFGHADGEPTAEEKKRLDELHLRKIDLADEVFVIDVDKYVGESTRREIKYALDAGKTVGYLSALNSPTPTRRSAKPITDAIDTARREQARNELITLVGQPNPVPGVGIPIADLVIDDLRERVRHGTAKYGRPLEEFNGRSALRDLYEELLDAVQYARQRLAEDARGIDYATFIARQRGHRAGLEEAAKRVRECKGMTPEEAAQAIERIPS